MLQLLYCHKIKYYIHITLKRYLDADACNLFPWSCTVEMNTILPKVFFFLSWCFLNGGGDLGPVSYRCSSGMITTGTLFLSGQEDPNHDRKMPYKKKKHFRHICNLLKADRGSQTSPYCMSRLSFHTSGFTGEVVRHPGTSRPLFDKIIRRFWTPLHPSPEYYFGTVFNVAAWELGCVWRNVNASESTYFRSLLQQNNSIQRVGNWIPDAL